MKTTKAQMDQLVKLVADNPGSTAAELFMFGVGSDGGPTLRDAEKAGRIFEGRDGDWNVKTEETHPPSDHADNPEILRDLLVISELMIRSLGPAPRSQAAPKAAPAKVERPEPVEEVHFTPDGQPRYSRS